MELANTDLCNLKKILKIDKFETDEVRLFAHQILCGLSYLHQQSISHRDLKPQNILACWKSAEASGAPQSSSITLKLGDFGLSRYVHEKSFTATAVGTRGYMAPEVAKSFSMNLMFHGDYKKADVFSMGVIIYEMLHGTRPFTEVELLTLKEEIISHRKTGDDEEHLMKYLSSLLKWAFNDRWNADYAKNVFKPKVGRAEFI